MRTSTPLSISRHRISIGALIFALAMVSDCSSLTAPRPLPTVLVTNTMCDAAHCGTLEIRAFVWKFTVPQQPWGLEVLGYVRPGQACLTFPASWPFSIIGPDSTGRIDTTTITWTPNDTIPIYLIAVDSTFFHSQLDSAQIDSVQRGIWPFDGVASGSVGETGNFVPGDAPGWSITFPSPPGAPTLFQGGVRITADSVCKP